MAIVEGNCPKAGYGIENGGFKLHVTKLGPVTFALYTKPPLIGQTLLQVGQSKLNSRSAKAKAAAAAATEAKARIRVKALKRAARALDRKVEKESARNTKMKAKRQRQGLPFEEEDGETLGRRSLLGETGEIDEQQTDCKVSSWSDFTECTKECGGGTQRRSRTVTTHPDDGGATCPKLTEKRRCNTVGCPPQDCVVGAWGAWGKCTKTCGTGSQVKHRKVVKATANGGKACAALQRSRACGTSPCPVTRDCKVSGWSSWGLCSQACGGGTQAQTRTVSQSAQHGGASCPILKRTRDCNTASC
jgi:hypothetical protein